MAHILTTHSTENILYTPIASIKQYNEPDFERKLLRYASLIFDNYLVYPCKFPMTSDSVPGSYEPDLILISKTFKKWVLIEVELCKSPSSHTVSQILCFNSPKFDPNKLIAYLETKDTGLVAHRIDLVELFNNVPNDLIVVVDDYSDLVFSKFRSHLNNLKICVLEVYKTLAHPYEAFRFGGDYPYELTNSSKLKWYDVQHYEILKSDFADDLPPAFEVKFHLDSFGATLLKHKNRNFLKLPEHNIPEDIYIQIGITLSGEFVLQRF